MTQVPRHVFLVYRSSQYSKHLHMCRCVYNNNYNKSGGICSSYSTGAQRFMAEINKSHLCSQTRSVYCYKSLAPCYNYNINKWWVECTPQIQIQIQISNKDRELSVLPVGSTCSTIWGDFYVQLLHCQSRKVKTGTREITLHVFPPDEAVRENMSSARVWLKWTVSPVDYILRRLRGMITFCRS